VVILEMGSRELFAQAWPQTTVLPILASQVVRIYRHELLAHGYPGVLNSGPQLYHLNYTPTSFALV
jgi:hypothetical protein